MIERTPNPLLFRYLPPLSRRWHTPSLADDAWRLAERWARHGCDAEAGASFVLMVVEAGVVGFCGFSLVYGAFGGFSLLHPLLSQFLSGLFGFCTLSFVFGCGFPHHQHQVRESIGGCLSLGIGPRNGGFLLRSWFKTSWNKQHIFLVLRGINSMVCLHLGIGLPKWYVPFGAPATKTRTNGSCSETNRDGSFRFESTLRTRKSLAS